MADDVKKFMIEDARIIFRNFTGVESQYNRAGDRNFAVILDPKIAKDLERDGWNVKWPKQREDDEDVRDPYIPIAVNFKQKPPKVVMITDSGRTIMTEETVGVLDWADIRTADLIARAYEWAVGGKTGIKAYLQSLFVTVEEDELERKYGLNDPDRM